MPEFTDGLPVLAQEMLTPIESANGSLRTSSLAHQKRLDKLGAISLYQSYLEDLIDRRPSALTLEMPFVTPEGIRDTLSGTQIGLDNHRILTPHIQEILHYSDTREWFLEELDQAAWDSSATMRNRAIEGGGNRLYADVTIIGSGPHGSAAATTLASQYPDLRVLMVDRNPLLGSFWRNNGSMPSLRMNSRVRRADYNLPAIPRTPGSINPLGRYAPLELSDIVQGNYALDVELGTANAINSYLGTTATLTDTNVLAVYDQGDHADMVVVDEDGEDLTISSSVVLNAPGIRQFSAITSPAVNHLNTPSYFNTNDFYKYMGNDNRYREGFRSALEKFHEKVIVVAGGGDSALTTLEALLGNLPPESYGPYGPGRFRPTKIFWIGAPGETAQEIDQCLRSRYKNGIVQALPKGSFDQGAIIEPTDLKATGFTDFGSELAVRLENGTTITADYLIDCTNIAGGPTPGPTIVDSGSGRKSKAVFNIGAGGDQKLPDKTIATISRLGIGENTASLWALMDPTMKRALRAGKLAAERAEVLADKAGAAVIS